MAELSEETLSGIRFAADIILGSKQIVVLTGAGISTPSGIPDFRSANNGLWEKYDPFEVASLSTFRYHPEKFYQWIRSLAVDIHAANPNAAHLSMARLEKLGYVQTIITQNIDMLHQRAGSENVLEVHGSIQSLICVRCYHKFDTQRFTVEILERGEVPYCPDCGGVLKPDLILMGEQLPAKIWLKALEASKKCDLMIVAGSSLEVLPVAGLPMRALENGARLVLINNTPTYLDVRADVVLHENVVEIIPRIADEVVTRGCFTG
jgi:NAD-dependent deacetylase